MQANNDAAIEEMIAVTPVKEMRDRARETLAKVEIVDALPPYFGLMADPEGMLWAVVSPPGDPETTLQGVVPGSPGVVTVHLPPKLVIYEVGRDCVLGTLKGEYDVQTVVEYRLDREAVHAALQADAARSP
ncbi:MAG: hypothetical protein PVJ02_13420 [Gemmatimonadota bacterium]|jgi:hypothetical protein